MILFILTVSCLYRSKYTVLIEIYYPDKCPPPGGHYIWLPLPCALLAVDIAGVEITHGSASVKYFYEKESCRSDQHLF